MIDWRNKGLVEVFGDSDVGKTRLVWDRAVSMASEGHKVLWCMTEGKPPLGDQGMFELNKETYAHHIYLLSMNCPEDLLWSIHGMLETGGFSMVALDTYTALCFPKVIRGKVSRLHYEFVRGLQQVVESHGVLVVCISQSRHTFGVRRSTASNALRSLSDARYSLEEGPSGLHCRKVKPQ